MSMMLKTGLKLFETLSEGKPHVRLAWQPFWLTIARACGRNGGSFSPSVSGLISLR